MEWKEMAQKWNEIAPQVKARWNKLSDEDLKMVAGDHQKLVTKIREVYSLSAQDAEKQFEEFKGRLLNKTRQ